MEIDRQEDLCRGLADGKAWTVAELYVDRDISAYSGKRRPAYERMLDDLKNGVRDAVIVVDQDRLTRTPRELESFIDLADANGIALASVAGEIDLATSDGRFRARIMGTVARQESEKKAERLRRQREQAARLGKFQGGPRRYGYEPDGVTIRRDEAKVLRDVARRLLAGESARSVVLDLNDRGIPGAKGGRWGVTQLVKTIASARLAGLRMHHDEVVAEAEWKPILDRNTHERLRALLVDGRPASRGRPAVSLLGGIATCARCDAALHQTTQRGKRVYRCSTGATSRSCSGVIIQADETDRFVSEVILAAIDTKAVARAFARPNKKVAVTDTEDVGALDADLEALATDFGSGRISRREWLAAREPLEKRKKDALADLEPEPRARGSGRRSVAKLADAPSIDRVWNGLGVESRRDVVQVLVESMTVGWVGSPEVQARRTARLAEFPESSSNVITPDRLEIRWKA